MIGTLFQIKLIEDKIEKFCLYRLHNTVFVSRFEKLGLLCNVK